MTVYDRPTLARAPDPWRWLSVLVLVGATAYLTLLTAEYCDLQMDRDEAMHARQGQHVAHALGLPRAGDLLDWLRRPQWHPPAHGIVLGTWFLVWGSSTLTARLYSLLFFLLLGYVVFRWAAEHCTSSARRLALLPVFWLVTDPPHVTHATLGMLELPAAFWTAIALWWHTRALARPDRAGRRWNTLATAAAIMCIMTRYSFGIPLIAALGVSHLSGLGRAFSKPAERAEALRRLTTFAVPVGLILGGWLLGLGQLTSLLEYSAAQPASMERWTLQNLLYYPGLLVQAGLSSQLLAGAFAIALGWTLHRRRLGAFERVVLIYLAFVFVELFFVRQKSPRFGMPLGAPLWVVTAVMLDRMFGAAPAWLRPPIPPHWRTVVSMVALAAFATVSGLGFFGVLRSFPEHYENMNDGIDRAYRDIAALVKPWERTETHLVLFGPKDQWPGNALAFHLVSACDAHDRWCEVTVQDRDPPDPASKRKLLADEGMTDDRPKAIASADFLVAYGDLPAVDLGGRKTLLRRDYECELSSRPGSPPRSRTARVTVLGGPTSPQSIPTTRGAVPQPGRRNADPWRLNVDGGDAVGAGATRARHARSHDPDRGRGVDDTRARDDVRGDGGGAAPIRRPDGVSMAGARYGSNTNQVHGGNTIVREPGTRRDPHSERAGRSRSGVAVRPGRTRSPIEPAPSSASSS